MKELFTIIKNSGLSKERVDQLNAFTEQVKDNVTRVVQFIEPKLESGLEIIREQSSKHFDEILKDLKFPEPEPELEVKEEDNTWSNELVFQDFLKLSGVDWNRYLELTIANRPVEDIDFVAKQSDSQWLMLAFNWPDTDEGFDYWNHKHKSWMENVNAARAYGIPIKFQHVVKEEPKAYITLKGFITNMVSAFTWEEFLLMINTYEDGETKALKDYEPFDWIFNAVDWEKSDFGGRFWEELNAEWRYFVREAKHANASVLWEHEEVLDKKLIDKVTDELVEEEVIQKIDSKKELLNFKEFLKENGVDTMYFKTLVLEGDLGKLSILREIECNNWINDAFDWSGNDRTFNFWDDLDNAWRAKVNYAWQNNIDIEFGYYNKPTKLNFKKFLKHHNVDKQFRDGLLTEEGEQTFKRLKSNHNVYWIEEAFAWSDTTSGHNFWRDLHELWISKVGTAEAAGVKVVMGFKD